MLDEIVIVTGGNRGIGEAVGKALIRKDSKLIVISRNGNEQNCAEFTKFVRSKEAAIEFVNMDLQQCDDLGEQFQTKVMQNIKTPPKSIIFVQNAGLAITKRVGDQPLNVPYCRPDVQAVMTVNAVAPAILTEAFVRAVQAWPCEKKLLYISSGAGRRVYEGWFSYGASKAAVDHMARTLMQEQKTAKHPIVVVAYGPGVTETDMQKGVRAQDDDESMPIIAQLRKMKENGQVLTAERAAHICVDFLRSSKFGRNAIEDVYDILAEK